MTTQTPTNQTPEQDQKPATMLWFIHPSFLADGSKNKEQSRKTWVSQMLAAIDRYKAKYERDAKLILYRSPVLDEKLLADPALAGIKFRHCASLTRGHYVICCAFDDFIAKRPDNLSSSQ